jgi:hypothetical protein
LGLRRGDAAVAEFQKVIDRPTSRCFRSRSVIAALTLLQLGRAYVLVDDIPKAKTA